MKTKAMILAAALFALSTGVHAASVTRFKLPPSADGKPQRILEAVEVSPGTTTLYLSGQLASPVDPKTPMGPGLTAEQVGDTKAQTISALTKIKAILASHGYAMSDIIKMTCFVAPDPKLGHMDFAGLNAGFEMFFNTPENPNTLARSAVQVGALALPAFLVEIEVTAAKAK